MIPVVAMLPPAGILLPQSVLTSAWFQVLALIVAFNTIIYVGLTLSKLVPWPHQFHPSRVRAWLMALGANVGTVPAPVTSLGDEPTDPYEQIRGRIARRDIPQAFGLFGILLIVISVVSALAVGTRTPMTTVANLAFGVGFLLLAGIVGRSRTLRPRVAMWLWVIACTIVVASLITEAAVQDALAPVAYALILMAAFAPVTLAWRPTFAASATMMVIMVAVTASQPALDTVRSNLAAVTALLVGWSLLRLRLVAVDALADERARADALATTDVLTGTLTRHGLLSLLPGLAATAQRIGEPICLMFFDIERLAMANQQYGLHYGDDVLRAVARSITEHVRTGDLVARWGGDEFLAVGIGGKPDAEVLAARIQEAVRETGVNLGKWPTTVRIGTSSGDPASRTFEQLFVEASETVEHQGGRDQDG